MTCHTFLAYSDRPQMVVEGMRPKAVLLTTSNPLNAHSDVCDCNCKLGFTSITKENSQTNAFPGLDATREAV